MKQKHVIIPGIALALVAMLLAPMPQVWAATPSPTPSSSTLRTPSPTPSTATSSGSTDDTVKQNILDRIDKVLDQKPEVMRKKSSAVGTVSRVTTEFITVQTLKGEQTVKIMPGSTVIVTFPRSLAAKLEDVELNGFVVIMGFMNDEDVLEARRILVSTTNLFPKEKRVVIGKIVELATTSFVVTTRDNREEKIVLGRSTAYEDVQGEAIKRTSLEVDTEVLAVFQDAGNASAAASLVRISK
jgi:hypothetical protein